MWFYNVNFKIIWGVVCIFIECSFAPATRYSHWMRNQGQFIVKMILAYAPIREIHTAYQLNRASNDDVYSACVTVKQLKFAIDSIFAIWQKELTKKKIERFKLNWIEIDVVKMLTTHTCHVTHQQLIHIDWNRGKTIYISSRMHLCEIIIT